MVRGSAGESESHAAPRGAKRAEDSKSQSDKEGALAETEEELVASKESLKATLKKSNRSGKRKESFGHIGVSREPRGVDGPARRQSLCPAYVISQTHDGRSMDGWDQSVADR